MKRLFCLVAALVMLASASGCTPGELLDSSSAPGSSSAAAIDVISSWEKVPSSKLDADLSSSSQQSVVSAPVSSKRVVSSKSTGETLSKKAAASSSKKAAASSKVVRSSSAPAKKTSSKAETPVSQMVWVSRTGKKYHSNPHCSNMKEPWKMTLDEAVAMGRTPCSKCY